MQSQINRDGVVYVCSRAKWYRVLHKVAADDNNDRREIIEGASDAFKISKWEETLKDIKDSEEALRTDVEDYDRKQQRSHLYDLKNAAERLEENLKKKLGQIASNTDQMREMMQALEKDKASETIGKFSQPDIPYKSFMEENPPPAEGSCNKRARSGIWASEHLAVTGYRYIG